ncbi:transporter substrate-binding domain-containing protein [Brachybacterium sp. AOP24-D1-21]|uniref:transporter substrate-binding domain-containing protein n=2 Tax=Brachybacterium TaxID=43668 RepID=UPI0040332758
MRMGVMERVWRLILLGALLLAAAGCQGSFPADTQGTLDRVTGGELRVGIAENPPWTEVAPDGAVSGSEVDLLSDYAETIDAEIRWVPGGENVLAAEMKEGNLDLVVGGLASDVPWTSEIALTRPYTTTQGPDGKPVDIVMGVRPGENALLVDLERYLAERGGEL